LAIVKYAAAVWSGKTNAYVGSSRRKIFMNTMTDTEMKTEQLDTAELAREVLEKRAEFDADITRLGEYSVVCRNHAPALARGVQALQAEVKELTKKQPINTHVRLFDLVRYDWDRMQADCRAMEAENERLRNGGCARDQRLTQFCPQAEDARKECERLRKLCGKAHELACASIASISAALPEFRELESERRDSLLAEFATASSNTLADGTKEE
jgi:hypothetical protein